MLHREITHWTETDVLVVGASPTGVAAAVCAAREGAKTMIVDQLGVLGGQFTAGMVFTPGMPEFFVDGSRLLGGIVQEFHYRFLKVPEAERGWPEEQSKGWCENWVWPTAMQMVLDEMLREAGVTVGLHMKAAGVLVEDGSLNGVIFVANGQVIGVRAKVTVDATGDAEVAALAGARCDVRPDPRDPGMHGILGGVDIIKFLDWLPTSGYDVRYIPDLPWEAIRERAGRNESFSVIKLHGLFEDGVRKGAFRFLDDMYVAPGFLWLRDDLVHTYSISRLRTDALDPFSLTRCELDCRRQHRILVEFYRKLAPGFENAFVLALPATMGLRETRQIAGVYQITEEDLKEGRVFADGIGVSTGHDERGVSTAGHDIPYRSLVPEKIDGLLAAGRCISADVVAQNSIRGVIPCVVSGQAAGVAAALAIKSGTKPRDIDISELRERLDAQRVALR